MGGAASALIFLRLIRGALAAIFSLEGRFTAG
jgi:hypothetical protein